MQIVNATAQSRDGMMALLQSAGLPFEDIPADLPHFYTAVADGRVVGAIGMEQYGNVGLLRSMVVHPAWRNQHIAAQLVKKLEDNATANGITEMYLLTETADEYFRHKGYRPVQRSEVPEAVKGSSEFSHVCPASARVMKKVMA